MSRAVLLYVAVRVTVFPVPMSLESKIPVTVAVIASVDSFPVNTIPKRSRVLVVVPSYTLSPAVMPETVMAFLFMAKVSGLRLML